MAASAQMPVEAKPFPPGQECCCASWADVHLTSFREGKVPAYHRKKRGRDSTVIGNIYHLPHHLTPSLIHQHKVDLRHPTFELIYDEAQFAILLQWLCQRPIEPWMLRSVSSNPNRHLRLVSCRWGLRWISPPFTFPCQSTGCCHVKGWELGSEMNGI